MDVRYQELAKRIGLGQSGRMARLFSMLADQAETELLLALPGNAPVLAEKLDRPEQKISQMLQNLFIKGLVFPSFKTDPPTYRMCRDVIQFHDATILWPDAPQEFLNLWQEWTEVEWPDLAKLITKAMPQPGMRIIPVGVSVQADAQVLAFEDVKGIIENARSLAVTQCTCRKVAHKCDNPLEVCLQVNNAAEYAVTRGTGRRVTKEEALDIVRKSEELGLIHATFNQKSVDHVICNCCACCCQFMPVLIKYGTGFVAPSRFQAQVNEDLCTACEICLDRCAFGAFEMDDDRVKVIADKCFGCGVCQVTCPEEAISMIEVRAQDFVPDKLAMH